MWLALMLKLFGLVQYQNWLLGLFFLQIIQIATLSG